MTLTALLTALWSLLLTYLLWVLYVFAMSIWRLHTEGRATRLLWGLAIGLVLFAIILDVILNYTVLAVLTWDFPQRGEWTFSKRLGRLVRSKTWRAPLARVLASILDPFDPSGKHVK